MQSRYFLSRPAIGGRSDRRGVRILSLCSATLIVLTDCSHQVAYSELVSRRPSASARSEPGGLVYALPKTVVAITGSIDGNKKVTYQITPSILPDANFRYRIKYVGSGFSDDDVGFHVDNNGLLNSENKATSTDQTGAIIEQAVRLAGAATHLLRAERIGGQETPYPFQVVVDLDEFASGAFKLPDGAIVKVKQPWVPAVDRGASVDCGFSLCFRTTLPIIGSIEPPDGAAVRAPQAGFGFVGINPYRTEGIDLRTAALVTRTNSVTFADGLVTGVAINKPSSALAVAKLPLTLIGAFFDSLGGILSLKIKNETTQAKAQADLAAALTTLNENRQKLQNTQANPGPVTGVGTAP